MRVGYIRVSTVDQNTDRQLDGIAVERVFTDKASGKDTADRNSTSCSRSSATATPSSCTRWTASPATSTTYASSSEP